MACLACGHDQMGAFGDSERDFAECFVGVGERDLVGPLFANVKVQS
jgi:hypothetical protein